MGGYGSGRWHWHTKRTVEQCLTLSAYFMQREKSLEPGRSGVLSWSNQSGEITSRIGYKVSCSGEILTLDYTKTRGDKPEAFRTNITLEMGPANYGGYRIYFLCPSCSRRRSKLYLPPPGNIFACRKCYNLTYRSCQESHRFDSLYRSIALQSGATPDQIRRAFTRAMK